MPGSEDAPVLIVEDDCHALSGYLEYLAGAGYEVVGAADGSAALPLAMARGARLVVTDIGLPGMNGFDLATALRAFPLTRAVPIIGITANWGREIHLRASAVQMTAVLRKPCLPAHLLAEVERAVRGHNSNNSDIPGRSDWTWSVAALD